MTLTGCHSNTPKLNPNWIPNPLQNPSIRSIRACVAASERATTGGPPPLGTSTWVAIIFFRNPRCFESLSTHPPTPQSTHRHVQLGRHTHNRSRWTRKGSEKVAADNDQMGYGRIGELRGRTKAHGQSMTHRECHTDDDAPRPPESGLLVCFCTSELLLVLFDSLWGSPHNELAEAHYRLTRRMADTSSSDDEVRLLSANQRFRST